MFKQTFFLVRPRKRERPTRYWTADIRAFLAFKSMAPAAPMIGLRCCIFLLAHCGGTAIALKTLYRVGASCTHSFISFDHLNFLRSSREVHFNTDFFFLTSFLHSFSSSQQKRLISDGHKSFDLNAAKPTPEEVLDLQRAMPRPCKFCGNSLEMILLG